ncbi:hypothetical protein F8M41_008385 [Gigaspora margarita]|uniref:Uncharacterized protein n=1 Tax=Gigaspora margarita TaxID=4874 RepID=A0A8H4AVT4_GIGMA|nr:hypothetical protein F8M41_008385 [Gigaspora margarita]
MKRSFKLFKKKINNLTVLKSNTYLTKEKNNIIKEIEEYWERYDTYSNDISCYYRKVARENDFELVGWYRLKSEVLYNNISIHLTEIKKINSTDIPKFIIVAWDSEWGSSRGPEYLLVGDEKEDYIYMIQFDIFFYNNPIPLKRYNITILPINVTKFFQKYLNGICKIFLL